MSEGNHFLFINIHSPGSLFRQEGRAFHQGTVKWLWCHLSQFLQFLLVGVCPCLVELTCFSPIKIKCPYDMYYNYSVNQTGIVYHKYWWRNSKYLVHETHISFNVAFKGPVHETRSRYLKIFYKFVSFFDIPKSHKRPATDKYIRE